MEPLRSQRAEVSWGLLPAFAGVMTPYLTSRNAVTLHILGSGHGQTAVPWLPSLLKQ